MKWFTRPRDTIARRFAVTILLAVLATIGLGQLYKDFARFTNLPPLVNMDFLDQTKMIVKIIEAAPRELRPMLAASAENKGIKLAWYPDDTTFSDLLANTRQLPMHSDIVYRLASDENWRLSFFKSNSESFIKPDVFFVTIQLSDKSYAVFTAVHRNWGFEPDKRIGIMLVFLLFSIVLMSFIAARRLAKPIEQFSDAVRRFGSNPRAPQINEAGPQELQIAIRAFNAMQAQIQKFVADRTAMLMAISHDLRTPLTRMRLRGEFIADGEQQEKLFRDVDDMHAMIDAALDFFRDDAKVEETTLFDLSELLQTIRDDYLDQGVDIPYHGPEHTVYLGRPAGLKRVFTNLIDNALKYGTTPKITQSSSGTVIQVAITDHGPGIPAEYMEQVFLPFYRLEGSRNRKTGGVGLGLTVVRTIIHSHGGDIVLRNRDSGGLEAVIMLPQA